MRTSSFTKIRIRSSKARNTRGSERNCENHAIMIIERKTKRSKYELRISNRYLVETEAEAKIGDNRRVIR